MIEMSETQVEKGREEQGQPAAPINGVACAFALLVDQLEANGALAGGAYQSILSSILEQPGIDQDGADASFLSEILDLLKTDQRPILTLLRGGRDQA